MKKVMLTIAVTIFVTVVFGQAPVKTDIKPADLPKCIIEWNKKNLPNFMVDKAYKLESNKMGAVSTYIYVQYKYDKAKKWMKFTVNCGTAQPITEAEFGVSYPPAKPKPVNAKPVKADQGAAKP